MITLYQFATSPFSERVERALTYKEIPFGVYKVNRAAVASGIYAQVGGTVKCPAIQGVDFSV